VAAFEAASEEALSGLPGRVLIVGDLNDPRAIPVLRRALQAPNVQIQSAGAMGLAMAGDKDSIPLILDVCSKAPEAAPVLAMFALVHFDDPRAQNGAAQYLSKDMLQAFEGKKLYLGPVPKRVTPQP